MAIPRIVNRWLRLPGRIALILGLGALSTAGTRADTAGQGDGVAFGDALVRTEGGKIYLSEGGRETELQLSATPQRDHLLRLLEERGPASVKLDSDPRLIMSSGGGAGFYWWRAKKTVPDKQTPASQNPPQMTAPPGSSKGGSSPRDQYRAFDKQG
ncbi:MAG: hypothetical protein ACJ8AH_15965 [Stellaceae bacterium]